MAVSSLVEQTPFSILGKRLDTTIALVKEDNVYAWYGAWRPVKMLQQASIALSQNTAAAFEEIQSVLRDFVMLAQNDHILDKTQRWGGDFDEQSLACWLAVRMTKPTDAFTDKPRWHRDGIMFERENVKDAHNKYAMTLLGNSTLALVESNVTRAVLGPSHEMSEEELIAALADEKRVDIHPKDIIKFSWGQDDSPIHSEPDMSTDRVFVSILFASEKEMRSMCEWRQEEYRVD